MDAGDLALCKCSYGSCSIVKRFKHRIAFIDLTRTQNASMEFILSDKALGTRSGTISKLSSGGTERKVAEQHRSLATHELRMRYSAKMFTAGETVKTDWIVVYDNRRFGVLDYSRDGEFGRNSTVILQELS